MAVVAQRKAVTYAFAGPEELLQDLDDQGVTHIVVDELLYPHTRRHLIPALQTLEAGLQGLQVGDTWVIER
jgi:hypothetical protein